MILQEIKELKKIGNAPFKIKSRSNFKDDLINVNHKLAIKIEAVSSHYDTSADISIFGPNGSEVGTLCFTKEIGLTNWRRLTENQFIAFLNEASFADREDDFTFNYNYLVINDNFYDDYVSKYKENSSLWGGFNHPSTSQMLSYKKPITRINILEIKLINMYGMVITQQLTKNKKSIIVDNIQDGIYLLIGKAKYMTKI